MGRGSHLATAGLAGPLGGNFEPSRSWLFSFICHNFARVVLLTNTPSWDYSYTLCTWMELLHGTSTGFFLGGSSWVIRVAIHLRKMISKCAITLPWFCKKYLGRMINCKVIACPQHMRHQVDAGQVPLSHICATESYLTLQITNNAPPASPTGLTYKWTI